MANRRRHNSDSPGRFDWEVVFREHGGWLRTVVLARVGEPQAVDDVMQEVSLAAVRQRRPLADPSKLAPWLYQLAVRQSLLYRRRQGRRQQRAPTNGESESAVDLLASVLAEERREMVRSAVARLPRRDTEILLLKYVHGWSYGKVMEHLGISHAAVANRLRRARVRLRAELAKLEIHKADL
ncbi:MAG: RNA polymerase sigma factor [Planctomycetota bacterium]|jgi:RNA polymerase sigma-70 factor (ECF subfamily)